MTATKTRTRKATAPKVETPKPASPKPAAPAPAETVEEVAPLNSAGRIALAVAGARDSDAAVALAPVRKVTDEYADKTSAAENATLRMAWTVATIAGKTGAKAKPVAEAMVSDYAVRAQVEQALSDAYRAEHPDAPASEGPQPMPPTPKATTAQQYAGKILALAKGAEVEWANAGQVGALAEACAVGGITLAKLQNAKGGTKTAEAAGAVLAPTIGALGDGEAVTPEHGKSLAQSLQTASDGHGQPDTSGEDDKPGGDDDKPGGDDGKPDGNGDKPERKPQQRHEDDGQKASETLRQYVRADDGAEAVAPVLMDAVLQGKTAEDLGSSRKSLDAAMKRHLRMLDAMADARAHVEAVIREAAEALGVDHGLDD